MSDPIGDICLAEIEGLHRFFVRWLGDGAADPAEFAGAEAAWPADFVQIAPDGAMRDRAALAAGLRQARGCHADPTRPFQIEVRDAHIRTVLPGGFRLCVYDEWQSIRGVETLRRSTALMQVVDGRALWRHLQETWVGQPPTG